MLGTYFLLTLWSTEHFVFYTNEFNISEVTRPHFTKPDQLDPWINTLRPRHNGRHFADDIFKCIFLNENAWIPIKISLKFVLKGPINYIPALVQIMAWRRPGDKPLSETMMVRLLTYICVTRPQWVKDQWKITPVCNFTSTSFRMSWYIDGLVRDCSNSIANALELLQSCTKPQIYPGHKIFVTARA